MTGYESEPDSSTDTQADPWYIREIDEHTGVGDSLGVPYTYEHVEEAPGPEGEVFRVVAELTPKDRPIHKNVYFVDARRFPKWIEQHDARLFEKIVSIRPISRDEAEREFMEFGDE